MRSTRDVAEGRGSAGVSGEVLVAGRDEWGRYVFAVARAEDGSAVGLGDVSSGEFWLLSGEGAERLGLALLAAAGGVVPGEPGRSA